jgi:hypothetical protein
MRHYEARSVSKRRQLLSDATEKQEITHVKGIVGNYVSMLSSSRLFSGKKCVYLVSVCVYRLYVCLCVCVCVCTRARRVWCMLDMCVCWVCVCTKLCLCVSSVCLSGPPCSWEIKIGWPGPLVSGILRSETVKRGNESCGTRTREWLRWRGSAVIICCRSILSSERRTTLTNPQLSDSNKVWSGAPDECLIPRQTGRQTVGGNTTLILSWSTMTSSDQFQNQEWSWTSRGWREN